jgi:hypothetical protein
MYGNQGNDTVDGGTRTDYGDGGPGRRDWCVNVEVSVRCELC